ncbi:Uu.00g042370.m01.CDS01 [Anthostomella pinea]|uniref:Uu.00g042370.m01.CDS01 n=1 Tax=Anthostomella pinea TaxID=933095 RepID=A0AAI8VAF8_9PEZI|nr:Uu.00g042370.m01.CDS01 [Anthostomella pinea]
MALLLGAQWVWDLYERFVSSHHAKKSRPVPLTQDPTYSSKDVSIIVPTIDTDDAFADCLRLWLQHKPREIIIVTVERDFKNVQQLVEPVEDASAKITVLMAPEANKRRQLQCGIDAATGEILALVDDDVFWPSEENTLMPHLLAPFEDPEVGATCGLQSAEIPLERQNPHTITSYEAAAMHALNGQNNIQAMRYAADGGCWFLSGRTVFASAVIFKVPDFAHAFTHEFSGGRLRNTGDVFLSHWVQEHGWKLCIQNAPEAEVTTEVMPDSRYVKQMLRWQRDGIHYFMRAVSANPGFWLCGSRKHPYSTRKMVDYLLKPIWSWVYILTWMWTMYNCHWMAVLYAAHFIYFRAATYGGLARKYPYLGHKVWGAFPTRPLLSGARNLRLVHPG